MKTFSLLIVLFFVYSIIAFAQDTSFAVSSNGNVGIGTSTPGAKLEVNSGSQYINSRFTTSAVASTISFHNSVVTSDEVMVGAQGSDLRLITNGTDRVAIKSDGKVGIGTLTPDSELDVNGTMTISGANTNELNRTQTGDANLVPIAYANVNTNGTINTVATTSNVTLDSHTAGTGNYYFTIAGVNVSYLTTICIAILNGSGGGEIFWNSSGGGATLHIATRSSTGASEDKAFTFVVYKK